MTRSATQTRPQTQGPEGFARPKSHGLSIGGIVGIVIGVTLGSAFIVIVAVLIRKRSTARQALSVSSVARYKAWTAFSQQSPKRRVGRSSSVLDGLYKTADDTVMPITMDLDSNDSMNDEAYVSHDSFGACGADFNKADSHYKAPLFIDTLYEYDSKGDACGEKSVGSFPGLNAITSPPERKLAQQTVVLSAKAKGEQERRLGVGPRSSQVATPSFERAQPDNSDHKGSVTECDLVGRLTTAKRKPKRKPRLEGPSYHAGPELKGTVATVQESRGSVAGTRHESPSSVKSHRSVRTVFSDGDAPGGKPRQKRVSRQSDGLSSFNRTPSFRSAHARRHSLAEQDCMHHLPATRTPVSGSPSHTATHK